MGKEKKENKKDNIEVLPEKRNLLKEFIDLFKDLAIIILIVVFIRTFLVMPFQINGQSMYDSYYDREFIIVDRFSYLDIPVIKTGKPKRGDVVVFRPGVSKEKEYFIKRIIGLPGDTLKITEGKVYLLDKETNEYIELEEGYLSDSNKGSTFVRGQKGESIFEIPGDSYFVMGDNRNASTDSRTCFSSCLIEGKTNYITKDNMTGKLFIDLGYYNWIDSLKFKPFEIKFGSFEFVHPTLGIDTHPKWFSSPSIYEYK